MSNVASNEDTNLEGDGVETKEITISKMSPAIVQAMYKELLDTSESLVKTFKPGKVLDRFDRATLLECNLVTGRSHQIRVHLSTLGFPLYVDNDYGGFESFKISDFKKRFNLKKNTEERPILDRLSMHAYSIKFEHPITKETIYLTADYHRDFAAMLQLLQKYNKIYQ